MKLFLPTFLTLYLVSCTSNTIYKKPKNLIPKDTMVSLLTDIYIANSAETNKNKKLEQNVNYMTLVYDKYKIDSLRFIKSNTYYISKLEEYEDIFKNVESRLQKLQKKYENNIKIRDSIERKKMKDSLFTEMELMKDSFQKDSIKNIQIPK